LLRAIPVNTLPARHDLRGGEPVNVLCEGAISSAERARHLAWVAAEYAPASQAFTVASLRLVAQNSTVTSHNCAILLETLAARLRAGNAEASRQLAAAAKFAGRARDTWLHAAREVARVQTMTTPGLASPAAIETGDLCLKDGAAGLRRRALDASDGPDRPQRPPETLALEDVPQLVAAAHHACETLAGLAHADYGQVHAAAKAGRILVPTRSLPDDFDIPYRFARAPRRRAQPLLARYAAAGQASLRAADAVGGVAEMLQAPSRTLTLARAAVSGRSDPVAADTATWRSAGAQRDAGDPGVYGPVETVLLDLGVTDPGLLARGAQIDGDAERLIIDAAVTTEVRQRPARREPLSGNRCTGQPRTPIRRSASRRVDTRTCACAP
jgi:hypothetical protein